MYFWCRFLVLWGLILFGLLFEKLGDFFSNVLATLFANALFVLFLIFICFSSSKINFIKANKISLLPRNTFISSVETKCWGPYMFELWGDTKKRDQRNNVQVLPFLLQLLRQRVFQNRPLQEASRRITLSRKRQRATKCHQTGGEEKGSRRHSCRTSIERKPTWFSGRIWYSSVHRGPPDSGQVLQKLRVQVSMSFKPFSSVAALK